MPRKKREATEAAKALSHFGASKGGDARAAALTPEQRSEIARKAVQARWEKVKGISTEEKVPVLRATHSGEIVIGDLPIPCYVLSDETRVISHRALQRSLGLGVRGGALQTAKLFGSIEDKVLSNKNLIARISGPTQFLPRFGRSAFGYEATILADICEVVLEARRQGLLEGERLLRLARQCEILQGGFARVGIIALVDEATGYQYSRARDDLRRILAQYVSKELARWERTFEDEFYHHLHRLKGWQYDPTSTRRSHACAYYTVDLTYKRIHPDLLNELKSAREEGEKPNSKLFQWMTTGPQGGHPRLKQHLEGVVSLMSVASDWEQFQYWVDRRYPRLNDTLRIPFPEMDTMPHTPGDKTEPTTIANVDNESGH